MKNVNIKMLVLSLWAIVMIAGVPQAGWAAETTNVGSDYLTDLAQKLLKKGDMEGAVHEFKKALMLNPRNEEAKKSLQALGLAEPYYRGTKTNASQIAELIRNREEYQSKLSTLQQAQEAMKGQLDEAAIEKDALAYRNAIQREEIRSLSDKINGLEGQTKALSKHWDSHIVTMKEMYGRLDDMKNFDATPFEESISHLRVELTHALDKNIAYEDALSSLNAKFHNERSALGRRSAIESEMIDVLEEFVRLKQREIEDIRDEVVLHKIDGTLLEEQEQKIAALESELRAAQEEIRQLLSGQ